MPVEKSEESVTLRFANLGGDSFELVISDKKYYELDIPSAPVIERNKRFYTPLGIRSDLVNGRPHRVLGLREVEVRSLDRSDLEE